MFIIIRPIYIHRVAIYLYKNSDLYAVIYRKTDIIKYNNISIFYFSSSDIYSLSLHDITDALY